MNNRPSVEDIEKKLGDLEVFIIGNIGMSAKLWSSTISKLHALNIKLCQMKGEDPAVTHHRSEYIIGN